ncbi:MAG: DUF1080 domain-containing protein [Planctomycetota bacterium]
MTMSTRVALPALALLCGLLSAQDHGDKQSPGYTDTPIIPGQTWHVHDPARPHPPVVDPGPAGAPVPAPSDAMVLFGGKPEDLAQWTSGGKEARWKVEDGHMEVNGTGELETREKFGDCQLHLEWATPAEVKGDSQGRGNSGVFFFGRYEIQVLDSYQNVTYADGQAASIYGQNPPDVNACRKPGEWQTYDIVFRAPRFAADGKLVSPAVVTVIHNGVLVHDHREILGPTAHRSVSPYQKHEPEGSLKLQDHGNPVRYRNIWIRRLTPTTAK